MRKAAAIAATGLVCCAGLTACAPKSAPPALHTIYEASRPEAAALGFDRSLRHSGTDHAINFDCHPGTAAMSNLVVDHRTSTASAERAGAGWVVTLTYADGLSYRYEVRHGDGGYCVFRGPGPASFAGSN
ncbi:MAG TPA: hypothetical protein VE441_13870 [Mycobacterium sp.]|nr:hypothetical protein [Mycobacterium sp.]